MSDTILCGLEGTNPLAYLAALGTLRIMTAAGVDARLSWREDGRWRPILHTPDGSPSATEIIMTDLLSWKDVKGKRAKELDLSYEKEGKKARRVWDLKPKPIVFREFLISAQAGQQGDRRHADFAVAYGSEFVRDGNDNVKPTALHFTAGQQNFLEMVAQIAQGLTREQVEEALFGPWLYKSDLPVLRWDISGERLYALLASNPSGDKAQGVPGADWLAFQALPLFPCFPEATLGGKARVLTTGFEGTGKAFVFRWPLWTPAASLAAIKSIHASACHRLSLAERQGRGIALVLESQVRRSDHGYGTFSAAVPAVPGARAQHAAG